MSTLAAFLRKSELVRVYSSMSNIKTLKGPLITVGGVKDFVKV
jgi:hypothetical protein